MTSPAPAPSQSASGVFSACRWPLAAALTLLASAAVAHPHGRIDCQAQVEANPAGLAAIALRLTLDGASSASLLPRLQLGEDGQPAVSKEARQFGELVAGMFRQSGWMLKLQRLGADGQAAGPALDLADPEPATFGRNPAGQLTVSVRLLPDTPAASAHGWKLACLDPTWYWATGFATAAEFSASAPCQATLEAMANMAEQAQALQLAAKNAGVLGADQAAPGLLNAAGVRAPSGTIRCMTP
ncbi:MAG: DUF1007 family protein [Microbacteriaceae bacterium]|nr:DUF1007 family protein [Burkholderiaceae bacterium]